MNHKVNKDRKKLVTEEPQVKLPPKTAEELDSTLNPYMPLGIQKNPWYLPKDHHSLKPNIKPNQSDISNWYERGQKVQAATKYRKGACENCGAMSHKSKDCLERPRKKGAKWTGDDIKPDEVLLENHKLGFEAKRDRWNGFNPTDQLELVKEWEHVEKKRQELREQKTKEKLERAAARALQRQQGIEIESSDDSDDEDLYAEKMGQIGQKMDWILDARVTIRNLRIREDTAKYLRNLDLDSAVYDPKSRQMKENPYKNKDINETLYAGDGFERYTGQVKQVQDIQDFAWEADKKGLQFAMEANPTQGEILYKQFKETTSEVKTKTKGSLLERYGGEEHLDAPKELLLAQSEQYVEYDPLGKLKFGKEKVKAKSKYEEDILNQNHTTVFGSYWSDFKWGYACCHSTIKQSYCGGQAAIEAERANKELLKKNLKRLADKETNLQDQHLQNLKTKTSRPNQRLGEGIIELDKEKLEKALEEEKVVKKRKMFRKDTMTEEELEAYRMTRHRADDPMAKYIDSERNK